MKTIMNWTRRMWSGLWTTGTAWCHDVVTNARGLAIMTLATIGGGALLTGWGVMGTGWAMATSAAGIWTLSI